MAESHLSPVEAARVVHKRAFGEELPTSMHPRTYVHYGLWLSWEEYYRAVLGKTGPVVRSRYGYLGMCCGLYLVCVYRGGPAFVYDLEQVLKNAEMGAR